MPAESKMIEILLKADRRRQLAKRRFARLTAATMFIALLRPALAGGRKVILDPLVKNPTGGLKSASTASQICRLKFLVDQI
jgi:hypothetical protein